MENIQDQRGKGILLMVLSALSFTFMSYFIKSLGEQVPVIEKVFFRNLVSLIIAAVMIISAKGTVRFFGTAKNQKFLLLRSIGGLLGVVLNFYAIGRLTLADSTMLNKLSPFFVTIFATLFLKEHITRKQTTALVVVFSFALLIIKPEFSMGVMPALCGAISAACAGGAYTVLRYLKGKEAPSTIIFYFSLISVLGSLPFMIPQFVVPNGEQLFRLIMIGVAASGGQFCITMAYKFAKAGEVSIYNYTSLLFSILMGLIMFGELPDVWSMVGSAGIIIVAILLFLDGKRQAQKQ